MHDLRGDVDVIFTPPPTPNGGLHVGHVGGPYLRADLFVRLQRLLDRKPVEHATHIDSYQSYVAKRAAELGQSPSEVLAQNSAQLHEDFQSFGVFHSFIGDNTHPSYLRFLSLVIRALEQQLDLRSLSVPWCEECQLVMVESYAKGTCQSCLHDAYVNVCENCSMPQLGASTDAACTKCGSTGSGVREVTVIDVNVETLRDAIGQMGVACADSRRARDLFADLGAHQVLWSYQSEYGVAPEGLNQALNPWVEIFCQHLYCLFRIYGVDTDADFSQQVVQLNDLAPRIGYFIGVDNTYYYTILFTVLARALGIGPMVPTQVKTNPFMTLDGAKVSSSRGNAIWAKDVAGTAPVAILRAGLARSCPEYSPREYSPIAAMRSPQDLPDAPRTPWTKGSSLSVKIVRERLQALSTMNRFSVEEILNILDKATRRAEELRSNDPGSSEATALEHYLIDVREQLGLI